MTTDQKPGDGEEAVTPITNAQLLKIAELNRPPPEWYEGDEEDLF